MAVIGIVEVAGIAIVLIGIITTMCRRAARRVAYVGTVEQVEHVEQVGIGAAAQQVGCGVQHTGFGAHGHCANAPPAKPIDANATAKKRIAMSASPLQERFWTRSGERFYRLCGP